MANVKLFSMIPALTVHSTSTVKTLNTTYKSFVRIVQKSQHPSNMPLRIPVAVFGPRAVPMTAARRTLTTSPRMLLKEDGDRSPEQLEKKKQEQLKKQEQGNGEWHESLASSSESHIVADKDKVEDHDSHMSKLQEETKKKGEKGEL